MTTDLNDTLNAKTADLSDALNKKTDAISMELRVMSEDVVKLSDSILKLDA